MKASRASKSVKSRGRTSNLASGRTREYLLDEEVEALARAAAEEGRHGHRDATAIRVAYRHGLRASELCQLKWDQADLKSADLHVKRVKNGRPSVQPIPGEELRALRKLKRDSSGVYVFVTERGTPMGRSLFLKIVRRAGEVAGIPFKVHPHMLRHAAGYALANKGTDTRLIQQFLGHQNIQHTVQYTDLAPERLKRIWD